MSRIKGSHHTLKDGQGMKGHTIGICKRCGKIHRQNIAKKIQLNCDICGNEIERWPSLINQHNFCSHKCKGLWMREFCKGKNNPQYGKHLSEKHKKLLKEACIKSQKEKTHVARHYEKVLEECKILDTQGFRTIPLGAVIPDIIALKDGKVYAYEVEFGIPRYEKYNNIKFFDDIIWIIHKNGGKK